MTALSLNLEISYNIIYEMALSVKPVFSVETQEPPMNYHRGFVFYLSLGRPSSSP